MRRVSAPLAVASALVVGLAGPAFAVISVSGGTVSGDAANDAIFVGCSGGLLGAGGDTGGSCATLDEIRVNPGDGEDIVNLTGVTAASFPALKLVTVTTDDTLTAGDDTAEEDSIVGSEVRDWVVADSEDTVDGVGGDDLISGADNATGGPGNDTFVEVGRLSLIHI